MSSKIKLILSTALVVLLTGLLLFTQQYWQLDLTDLNLTKHVTTEYNQLVLFKGVTFLGKNLFLVVLGFLLGNETNLRYVRAIKLWLVMVVTSLTLQVVALYLNDSLIT